MAAIADSPSLPRREFEQALALARQFQFPVRVIRTREFANASYLANPDNRCYFCKHELFTELAPLAKAEGLAVIAYGENASDIGDYRPGAQAAAQFQVRAPLKEAGLTKADIRALSRRMGLPTWNKPSMACLASRIPYGRPITAQALKMVEASEELLFDMGFSGCRVRHHGEVARIETAVRDLSKALRPELRPRIIEGLKTIGFKHVAVDLEGYVSGSLNRAIKKKVD